MKSERNDSCPCGSGLKYKKCCLNKNDSETNTIDITADGLLSIIRFGLENSSLLAEGGKNTKVKNVSFCNGGDTMLVEFYAMYERAADIKGEMASIMGFLSGTFRDEIYRGYDIKYFGAKAFNKSDVEIMYVISSKASASTIADGNSIDWLRLSWFQENTEDYRLARAKTMISDIENGLRKVIADLYLKMFGTNWWDIKIEPKVNSSVKNTYRTQFGVDNSDGDILIHYTFPLDLKKIISADWGTFKHLFDGKTTFEDTMVELNVIRREEAHNRTISEQHLVDLERIYAALLEKIANHYPDVTVNYLLENWRSKIKELMIAPINCAYTMEELEDKDLLGKHALLLKDTTSQIVFWRNIVTKLKSLTPPPVKKTKHEELVSILEELLRIQEIKLNCIENWEFNDIGEVITSFADHLKRMDEFSKAFVLNES